MPLPTFTPPVRPSPGFDVTPELALREAPFGDGYTLAAPAGLNHVRQIVDLTWAGLTQAHALAIVGFLEAQGGYKLFYYQPLGFPAPVKWTCREWSATHGAPFTVQARMRQSFSLTE